MTEEPGDDGSRKGIDPNVALLLGAIAYASVNFIAILLLLAHVLSDVFTILDFFVFVAPPSASALVVLIHLALKRRFHPLALTAFIIFMLFATWLNLQFLIQAANAV